MRPRDDVVEAFAERVALELDRSDPRVPIELVEQGLSLLDECERRRIVDERAGRYPDRWASLCGAVGDVSLAERAVVASSVRGAISERRPTPHSLFVELEVQTHLASPCEALAVVLAPPLVWSRDEAILATHAASLAPRGEWMRAVDEFAASRVDDEHAERVSTLAARLANPSGRRAPARIDEARQSLSRRRD